MAICSPRHWSRNASRQKRTTPFDLVSIWLATAARDAAPPMWKVRIVSWVRLTDRLCCDHAHRLAGIDDLAATQIAAVTWHTARSGFHRSMACGFDFIDTGGLDRIDDVLGQQCAGFEHGLRRPDS